MHPKASAQVIGLDSGTLGWAMLKKPPLDVEVSEDRGLECDLECMF